jgi:hypothetical protein
MPIALSISPHGRLFVDDSDADGAAPSDGPLAKRVRSAFADSTARGLLHLATAELACSSGASGVVSVVLTNWPSSLVPTVPTTPQGSCAPISPASHMYVVVVLPCVPVIPIVVSASAG